MRLPILRKEALLGCVTFFSGAKFLDMVYPCFLRTYDCFADKETPMENQITVAELKKALAPDLERLLEEVALAVSQAPYGHMIAASEEPVRDAAAVFRQQLFQKALTLRQQQIEPAFSPSADSADGTLAQQRASKKQHSDDERACGVMPAGVLESASRHGDSAGCLCALLIWMAFLAVPEPAKVLQVPQDPDPAYTQVLEERARKIVDTLRIEDTVRARQVQDLIADQYRNLSMLHDARDAQIKVIQSQAGNNPESAKLAIQALKDMAQTLQDQLHIRYLLKLSALLTPAQVDQVKDGMTYGIVQVTYNSYLDMLPQLTEQQKATIMAYLVEAREIAMDAGSSSEKHQCFDKYKGRINNYLSDQGYDLKKASQERKARSQIQSR